MSYLHKDDITFFLLRFISNLFCLCWSALTLKPWKKAILTNVNQLTQYQANRNKAEILCKIFPWFISVTLFSFTLTATGSACSRRKHSDISSLCYLSASIIIFKLLTFTRQKYKPGDIYYKKAKVFLLLCCVKQAVFWLPVDGRQIHLWQRICRSQWQRKSSSSGCTKECNLSTWCIRHMPLYVMWQALSATNEFNTQVCSCVEGPCDGAERWLRRLGI